MRSTILFILAAGTALCGAHSAQAQRFTGPRVEVTAGYDASRADDGVPGGKNTLDGIRVGGAIGYDLALNRSFVVSVEAGIGFSASGSLDQQVGTDKLHLTSGRDIDLSLRAGIIAAPGTLLYVKGGYANSNYRVRTTSGTTTSKISDDNDGYRIGAGVEQAINAHVYAKAEYRYTGYGDDVSRHQVLAGVGYRF